jgi:hypothetical protein
VQKALRDAAPPVQAILLRALGHIGGDEALAQLKQTTTRRATDPAVRQAAIQVLSEWNGPAPAPHLIKLAREAASEEMRRRSWTGYIDLARGVNSTKKRAEMLREAEALATRPAQQRQWLSAWSTVHTPDALPRALTWLEHSAVRTEAAVAAIVIGKAIRQDHPDAVAEAMRQVLDRVDKQSIRERARKLLDEVS